MTVTVPAGEGPHHRKALEHRFLPVFADLARRAWLVLAAMAFNLTRATSCAAGRAHARAPTATLRTQLIGGAARIARFGRQLVLHLPRDWPWQTGRCRTPRRRSTVEDSK